LAAGDIGSLYEGTVGTLLAASVGHYPWFYMYNLLDGKLGVKAATHTDKLMFSSVRSLWSNTTLSSLNNAAAVAEVVTGTLSGLLKDLGQAISFVGEWVCALSLWENKLVRSAFIGFMASTVSDLSSNIFRVLKTIKQTSSVRQVTLQPLEQIRIASLGATAAGSASYMDIIASVIAEDGLWSLVTRGLSSRIISNGVQSILFTVVWKELMAKYAVENNASVHSAAVLAANADAVLAADADADAGADDADAGAVKVDEHQQEVNPLVLPAAA
jgi:hypothetical protein